jgi:glutaredoxin-like YruB-family protein
MALEIIHDAGALEARLADRNATIIVGLFGESSAAARKARPAFEQCCAAHPEQAALLVDVAEVPGLDARFGVSAVPTVLAVRGGRVVRSVVGPRGAAAYARALLGGHPAGDGAAGGTETRRPRVTVYTTPSCAWCTRLKGYLRGRGVAFDEVDVARDARAAERLVARSGQRGVPQTDVDGTIVVGFDQARLEHLLGGP